MAPINCILSLVVFFCITVQINSWRHQIQMKSIAVVGANGRTGRKVVNVALKKGYDVIALTRSGTYFENETPVQTKKLKSIAADVTSFTSMSSESVAKAIKGASAVVFAASASKEGGKPNEVDKQGLINVAKVCIENKIPRLVIVSSGAVTKPFSPVYLFLNLFGGIMAAKIQGENEVRKLYKSDAAKGLAYTVVRPGGLTEDAPRGVTAVELNQGDDMSGRISRWDVASICVESIDSKDAARSTFECYYQDSGQPLANVGLSNLLKMTKKSTTVELTGFERRGSTWTQLFSGLKSDV